jgi:hypothetical protein
MVWGMKYTTPLFRSVGDNAPQAILGHVSAKYVCWVTSQGCPTKEAQDGHAWFFADEESAWARAFDNAARYVAVAARRLEEATKRQDALLEARAARLARKSANPV